MLSALSPLQSPSLANMCPGHRTVKLSVRGPPTTTVKIGTTNPIILFPHITKPQNKVQIEIRLVTHEKEWWSGREKGGVKEPSSQVYDVIEATLGHLVQPYESYLLPYMVNNIVFKFKHMVQGQPRVGLFYYYRSHFQHSRNDKISYSWRMKAGTISCKETSTRNHQCSLRDKQEEKCFHHVWVSSKNKVLVKSFVNTCKRFSRLKYNRNGMTTWSIEIYAFKYTNKP